MRKLRIVSLILAILLVLPLLFACKNKTSGEDTEKDGKGEGLVAAPITFSSVEENPVEALSNGMVLSMQKSPLASLYTAGDGATLDFKMISTSQGETAEVLLSLAASDDLDLYAKLEADLPYMEKLGGELYFAKSQLVLKSALLKSVFGTETVGINFATLLEDLPKSELYEALVASDPEASEALEIVEDLLNNPKVKNLITDFLDGIVEMSEKTMLYTAEGEETIEVAGTDVEVIRVKAELNEHVYDEFFDEFIPKIMDTVLDVAREYTDELPSGAELDEFVEEAKRGAKDAVAELMSAVDMQADYYLAKETGALIGCEETLSMNMDGETLTCVSDIVFGADPTVETLPEFTLKMEIPGSHVIIDGKTEKDGSDYVTAGEVKLGSGGASGGTYKLTYSENGNFEFKAYEDEEEVASFGGNFKSDKDGFTFSMDLPIDGAETSIEISFKNSAKIPSLPKYKNVLDFSMEDLEGIFGGFDVDTDVNALAPGMSGASLYSTF